MSLPTFQDPLNHGRPLSKMTAQADRSPSDQRAIVFNEQPNREPQCCWKPRAADAPTAD